VPKTTNLLGGGFFMRIFRRTNMNPVKFAGMNVTFVAPGCDDLPAKKQINKRYNRPSVTSCWRPTDEELQVLNKGGCVCLSVIGGQPPVALWAQEAEVVSND
jgi:hypothetical protein